MRRAGAPAAALLAAWAVLLPAAAIGLEWGAEERLTVNTTVCETGLSHAPLALDSWGTLTITWAEMDGPRGNFRIYTCRRGVDGTWEPAELAVDFLEAYAGNGLGAKFPSLAVLPGDSLLMVWHDYRVAGIANLEVFGKVRGPGEVWGGPSTEERLTTSQHPDSAGDNSYLPNLVVDPAGTAHMAWYDYRYDPSRAEILFKSRAGGAWDTASGDGPDENASGTFGDSGFPALAAGPDGTLHLAWRDNTSGSYRILYANRPPGGAWSAPVPLSPSGIAADGVTLAADSGGALIAAWSDAREGVKAIFCREREPGGAWSAPRRASPSGAGAEEPALAVDAAGRRHLVWQDARVSILNREVFHQSIPAGGAWDSTGASDVTVSAGNGKSSRPSIVVDGAGRLFVMWQDARHGATEVYVRVAAPEATAAESPPPPAAFRAFPNPFRGTVTFTGPSRPGPVMLLDAGGRVVARLASDGGLARWDGRDAAGRVAPSGVYFARPGDGLTLRVVKLP